VIGGRAVIIGAIAVVGVAWWSALQAEKARVVPAPSVDESARQVTSEGRCSPRLLLGGAGRLSAREGVTGAVSGYASDGS
jgi:hypothetical protein